MEAMTDGAIFLLGVAFGIAVSLLVWQAYESGSSEDV